MQKITGTFSQGEKEMVERKAAKTFEDLIVWQKAHGVVLGIYRATARFPDSERYGLISQMRRAAVSIAANIVEGFRRHSAPDKARFLNISQGSLDELRYYFILARDLTYLDSTVDAKQLEEISKLLNAYARTIRSSNEKMRTEKVKSENRD